MRINVLKCISALYGIFSVTPGEQNRQRLTEFVVDINEWLEMKASSKATTLDDVPVLLMEFNRRINELGSNFKEDAAFRLSVQHFLSSTQRVSDGGPTHLTYWFKKRWLHELDCATNLSNMLSVLVRVMYEYAYIEIEPVIDKYCDLQH